MGTVMNIYGKEIDDSTKNGQLVSRWRKNKPIYYTSEFLEKWIRELIESNDEPFLIYCHKTKEYNVMPIMFQGLKIYEKNGGIESTMSRIFDSESVDIEGDINYFLNAIISSNQYGSYSIIAVMPKSYRKISELISNNIVPIFNLAFAIDNYGKIMHYGNKATLNCNKRKD